MSLCSCLLALTAQGLRAETKFPGPAHDSHKVLAAFEIPLDIELNQWGIPQGAPPYEGSDRIRLILHADRKDPSYSFDTLDIVYEDRGNLCVVTLGDLLPYQEDMGRLTFDYAEASFNQMRVLGLNLARYPGYLQDVHHHYPESAWLGVKVLRRIVESRRSAGGCPMRGPSQPMKFPKLSDKDLQALREAFEGVQ